jgi:RimJ/RimL family protein N-acetyltransferase
MHNNVISSRDLMDARLQTLYRYERRGRMTEINQWDGGPAPRFHLARTASGNLWKFHASLSDTLVLALTDLASREPSLRRFTDPPLYQQYYRELLESEAHVQQTGSGPAYWFDQHAGHSPLDVVSIDADNADLLENLMGDWLPDVPYRVPFVAAIAAGQAVAVCASVRITGRAHEAGVETHPDYRRQGFAQRAVTAWSMMVRELGAIPLYSTGWNNRASQSLAERLGLTLFGVDDYLA